MAYGLRAIMSSSMKGSSLDAFSTLMVRLNAQRLDHIDKHITKKYGHIYKVERKYNMSNPYVLIMHTEISC